MMSLIRFFVLAVCSLALAGCLLPEKFTAHLHIDKEQNYTFRYEGTMVLALMLAPGGQGPSGAEMARASQEIAEGIAKEPGVKSAKPAEDGRVRVVVEQSGRVSDQPKLLFGGITLKTAADQSVTLGWPAIPAHEDLSRVDYRLDGNFVLTTDGVISSSNGAPASDGVLGTALTKLGLKSGNAVQEVSWHLTRENYRTLPMAIVSGVAPVPNVQKATSGDIVFTSNVPNDDPAIQFATAYLQQVSQWKGDTIRWQVWTDAFFRGFAANPTWLTREVAELKQIDLKVYHLPLTQADQLNGKLAAFKVYVTPSAMRSMALQSGATYDPWSAPGEVYQPLIIAVERTAEGWSVRCSMALFGSEKAVALSPVLDQLDLRLAKVEYPMRVDPGTGLSLSPTGDKASIGMRNPAGGASSQTSAPPSPAAGIVAVPSAAPPVPEKLNLPVKERQKRRVQMFIALLHRELADGRVDALASRATTEGLRLNGRAISRAQIESDQKAYRDQWTMVREAPMNVVVTQTGEDSYTADYILHHRAEVRQTGQFSALEVAVSLKILSHSYGEYFQIAAWDAKVLSKKEGRPGSHEDRTNPLQGQRYQGVAHHPDYDWPFVLEAGEPDSTGRFTGKITWPTLGAVHKIHGQFHPNVIHFFESEVLSPGNASLGVHYSAGINEDGRGQGIWTHIEAATDDFSGGTWEMKPDL